MTARAFSTSARIRSTLASAVATAARAFSTSARTFSTLARWLSTWAWALSRSAVAALTLAWKTSVSIRAMSWLLADRGVEVDEDFADLAGDLAARPGRW